VPRVFAASIALFLAAFSVFGQDNPKRPPLPEPPATPAEQIKIKKDFKVELLYSVPKDKEGSWVNLCVDPKGRLIVSDQYGGLFRVAPPALGKPASDTRVEKIPAKIGEAHGLLWAFDRLYVVVNRGQKYASGLYEVRSSKDDDVLDEVTLLKKIDGGGEHGPHAVILGPDGNSLYIVCGNGTKMMDIEKSRVPRFWGEDHLLPRMPDGNGFMKDVLGPGGCIYRVDPSGQHWELISTGYRNPFDIAFNRQGDLFTFDADMEWDMNTPWYRPTRVCLAMSGSEFGWRNGAGKWPAYYPDSLPAVVNIGPGSPTGLTFGYGAKFPEKYQEAFFMCDWSYGKLYAVHLRSDGGGYTGEFEEFLSGTPLPLTDIVVNPTDGALYFTIGGRRTKSGLYRVTYAGTESTAPAHGPAGLSNLQTIRKQLEQLHGKQDSHALDFAWPHLASPDRTIRFAARVAIEHQPVVEWKEKALSETEPAKAIEALLALTRVTGQDPFHHPRSRTVDLVLKYRILAALGRLGWSSLSVEQQLDLLRVYAVLFNRMGPPDAEARKQLSARFDALYPAKDRFLNAELCPLLVYLEAPSVVTKTMKLMNEALTQEEQLEYARSLRVLKTGWTPEQRKEYFTWFLKAANFKGGNSLGGFLKIMKTDAVATLSEPEKAALKPILEAKPLAQSPLAPSKPRAFVKNWSLDEVTPLVEKKMAKRDFDRGRKLFAEAQCFACHRFDNEGGANGPDLTGAAGRFSIRDLLESIVEPSKVISDQYAAVNVTTIDGKVVSGRIVNHNGDDVIINTNMLDPNALAHVNRKKIESMETSKVSMMPNGLLDTFKEDEILDLVAYLLSRGDRSAKMYKP
jgi:putative heme-binding domain-containing protein